MVMQVCQALPHFVQSFEHICLDLVVVEFQLHLGALAYCREVVSNVEEKLVQWPFS